MDKEYIGVDSFDEVEEVGMVGDLRKEVRGSCHRDNETTIAAVSVSHFELSSICGAWWLYWIECLHG